MFTTQLTNPFHVAIATGVLGALFAVAPARAEDPPVRTPSVMNQNNKVYEETLKFYLHPARLEVIETPREMMDHPAVIIARRPKAGFDWTTAFILHPARLEVTETPREMMDHPAVIVAKAKRAPSDTTAQFTLHPAVAASKPKHPQFGHVPRFIPTSTTE